MISLGKDPAVAPRNDAELDPGCAAVPLGIESLPSSRFPRARRRAECRRRARTCGRRPRSRRRRRRRTEASTGAPATRAVMEPSVATIPLTATPSRNSTPAAVACSARKASSRRRWVMRMTGLLLASLQPTAIAGSKHEAVDDVLDDRRDVAGSVLERAAGEPSAAGLVPREAGAVCEQDARAAAREAERRCRPGGPGADDQDVEPLHEADRKHEAGAGLQWPALAGVPEWPKGAGCKPAGSAFGGSNPPPCTAVEASRGTRAHRARLR